MSGNRIQLVPTEPLRLGIEEAKNSANNAYTRARAAQRDLAANLDLLWLLWRPGRVSIYRLRCELREAQEQVERAQAVRDSITEAIASIEAGARRGEAGA